MATRRKSLGSIALAAGKVVICGTHPTRYGFATETDLMSIPARAYENRAESHLDWLREQGFIITRILHPEKG